MCLLHFILDAEIESLFTDVSFLSCLVNYFCINETGKETSQNLSEKVTSHAKQIQVAL